MLNVLFNFFFVLNLYSRLLLFSNSCMASLHMFTEQSCWKIAGLDIDQIGHNLAQAANTILLYFSCGICWEDEPTAGSAGWQMSRCKDTLEDQRLHLDIWRSHCTGYSDVFIVISRTIWTAVISDKGVA